MVAVQVLDVPVPGPTVAQVEALAATAADADDVEPLGEQTLLDLRDPDAAATHHLATDRAGQVIGYAALSTRGAPTAELVVAPHARSCGVGSAMLERVRSTAARLDASAMRVWAHGNLPAARRLATRAGLVERRELWQMRRHLDGDLPAGDLPPGTSVRPFVPGADDEALLAVNAAAFADHPEQGRLTLADLRARQREPWFRTDDLLLAERDSHVDGFAWLKVEPGHGEGELYVLGVHPRAQGTGLGRALTALALRRLADQGLSVAVLYTEADNTPAVRLYTAAGFTRSRVDVQYG